MSNLHCFVCRLVSLIGLIAFFPATQAVTTPPSSVSQVQASAALAGLTVPFEENQGQANAQVAFQARTLAGPLFVTHEGELVWNLTSPRDASSLHQPRSLQALTSVETSPSWSVVERFVAGKPMPMGNARSPTQVNHFFGSDRSRWQNGVPTWARVNLGQVWNGVEVSLAAYGRNVEKVFTVAPGADTQTIAIEVVGGRLALESDGALTVETGPAGDLPTRKVVSFTPPLAWQEIDGNRQPVQVAYRLTGESGNRYGFTLGNHNPAWPVVIDPLLQSTYLGGSSNDQAYALAVTTDAVYVAGSTESADFPGTTGGKGTQLSGRSDAFVAKLGLDLQTLAQLTYLGGSGHEDAYALAVTTNAVYVAGRTNSTDFPVTAGVTQGTHGGRRSNWDAFVASFNLKTLNLDQATYLGGSSDDEAHALAVTVDAVYVAGDTDSTDFPGTLDGEQVTFGGGYSDAFVAKFNLDLSSPAQTTYLGGTGNDRASALVVTSYAVYVAGGTDSTNFPGTVGGAQETFGGGHFGDAFVAKLNLDLRLDLREENRVTYLGGSGDDEAFALVVANDAVYVAGRTDSSNFPRAAGGKAYGGNLDAFVAMLSLDLRTPVQVTYLGASGDEEAHGLAVTADAVYVAGDTNSTHFPDTKEGAQAAYGGGNDDGFVAKFSLDLRTLKQATYLGGSGGDRVSALVVTTYSELISDKVAYKVFVAGYTESSKLPGTDGKAQIMHGGEGSNWDAFVSKFHQTLMTGFDLTVNLTGVGLGKVNLMPPGGMLSISPSADVTISPSLGITCGIDCLAAFPSGTNVTLTAIPEPGFVFGGWTGDCTGSFPCTLTMNQAHNVTANFSCGAGYQTIVQEAYRGYCNRCADRDGFTFWCKKLGEQHADVSAIISTGFGTSREYTALFGSLSDRQVIDNLYLNLFNRHADSDALNYWLFVMTWLRLDWTSSHGSSEGSQEYAMSRIPLAVLSGVPQGSSDFATLSGKIAVCPVF
ncbi:exported hypothetical protein [Gammaproteobacteria bacterium]